MSNYISVIARLDMLSADSGGRKSAVISGYRPNHVFEHVGNRLAASAGDIFFDGEPILPGQERTVTVQFHDQAAVKEYLSVGREWWVYEGWHLVGEAEIIKLL